MIKFINGILNISHIEWRLIQRDFVCMKLGCEINESYTIK